MKNNIRHAATQHKLEVRDTVLVKQNAVNKY